MSRASTRTQTDAVADGVFRLKTAGVNCYLIVGDDGIVLLDAGLPRTWPQLVAALRTVGAAPSDIDAIVLTHGHFDHVGMCDRLMGEHQITTHVHPKDTALVRHPYRYAHESPRLRYPFRHPAAIPTLVRMTAAGALWVKGVAARPDIVPGAPLDLPGGLTPIFSPRHTDGHCAFLLSSRGILFSGDALVTFDPYTARRGPRIVAGAATADSAIALHALDLLAATDAEVVLPGHGEPFRDGVHAAAQLARLAGAS